MSEYMTKVKSKTFTTELIQEGSWAQRDLGEHECTMDLYLAKDDRGCIEWDIPTLEMTQEIGLWFEIGVDGTRTLCDYDGVFSLPSEAVQLLEGFGVIVPEDFR